MKKYLSIFLGVVGVGLVAYSVLQSWTSWEQSTQYGMGFAVGEPTLGYQYWQGIAALVAALLAFGMLFFKPKIGILPAIAASGFALWVRFAPEPPQIPQSSIFIAIAGGVALALAGLIAPKKK